MKSTRPRLKLYGISYHTPIPLFGLFPETLQLEYDPGKRRNLLNVLGKEAHVQQLLLV